MLVNYDLSSSDDSDSDSSTSSSSSSKRKLSNKPAAEAKGLQLASVEEVFASVDTTVLSQHLRKAAEVAAAVSAPPPSFKEPIRKRGVVCSGVLWGPRLEGKLVFTICGIQDDSEGEKHAPRKHAVTDSAKLPIGPGKPEMSAAAAPKPAGLIGTPASAKAKQDKLTVKERTKHQRLAGQTGLDHREWRSEEEMRLRQQFDS